MSHTLYRYYEQELQYVREMAAGFAEEFPAAASRLRLDPNQGTDPHVERLIQSFAYLTARVQNKLDDEFPELTDALLSVLYPHYLAPVPSMSIVELAAETDAILPTGLDVDRGTALHTQEVEGTRCQFRTCYPVKLWPIRVTRAEIQTAPFRLSLDPPSHTASALSLRLRCQGDLSFDDLNLETLRFYLDSEKPHVAKLYELLFNHTLRIEVRSLSDEDRQPVLLRPEEVLKQVGLGEDEGLLPYPQHAFKGYRLLTELFSFPEKFQFVDLGGWRRVCGSRLGKDIEILFYFNAHHQALQQAVDRNVFRLGCTPIVNLFEKVAEPIPLTHRKCEYRVVPDVHRQGQMEIYSIDRVTSANPRSTQEYVPFYAYRHACPWSRHMEDQAYWYGRRRASHQPGDRGTEIYLTLVDLEFNPRAEVDEVVIPRCTCSNRDYIPQLLADGVQLRFDIAAAVPLKDVINRTRVTTPLRSPLGGEAYWRLVSHLSLNHLSLAGGAESLESLRELLRLYDFSDVEAAHELSTANRQMIAGITSIASRPVVGRIGGPTTGGFCRGLEVSLELDEQQFLHRSGFLFASVLERFFTMYTSINSFTQLVAGYKRSGRRIRKWSPREGAIHVL